MRREPQQAGSLPGAHCSHDIVSATSGILTKSMKEGWNLMAPKNETIICREEIGREETYGNIQRGPIKSLLKNCTCV